jgi:hypothetical protein
MFTANNDFGVRFAKERRAAEIEEVQARHRSGDVRRSGRPSQVARGAAALAAAATAAVSLITDIAVRSHSAQARRARRRSEDAPSSTQLAP